MEAIYILSKDVFIPKDEYIEDEYIWATLYRANWRFVAKLGSIWKGQDIREARKILLRKLKKRPCYPSPKLQKELDFLASL